MHIHRPLLPFNGIELDKVSEEFLDYQNMSRDEIPKDIWDEAICDEQDDGCNKVTYHRMDRILELFRRDEASTNEKC